MSDEVSLRDYLTQRLESIERKVEDGFQTVTEKQDLTNGRVKSLELWRAWLTGGVVFLASVGAIVGGVNVVEGLVN